ncbi:hypothetical protein KUG85_09115 [Nitratireductor sp. L1-7-SE]|uniref:TauD/TfdA-like domain-containing protein n=1 Tax=Nitratireductor rhodophyticola TaxID=2854036 RepID=A0ABS7RBK4_9HYPH|nr:hypothetical protein [Nitratireductor rhodophyticola]MBY8918332.1 hypothetical protein [Nitratireductor rhodophyticola]MBY8920859.1 hypothetical protein [Nitratireductor rhodophyticola]
MSTKDARMHQSTLATEAPSFSLDREFVREFCHDVLEVDGQLQSLGDTKNAGVLEHLSCQFRSRFSDTVVDIETQIAHKACGIAVVDVPSVYEDVTDDAIAGALVSIAATSALIKPSKDIENLTPFTMFSASCESSRALRKAGLPDISPTDILDFHSDGLICGKSLGVPRYIAIYNTFINYRKCGFFYWVPTSSIEALPEHLARIGLDDDFTFELTPAVYGETGSKIDRIVERRVRTAIFRKDVDGSIVTFMNGKFTGKDGADADFTWPLKAFQNSIAKNPFRYAVEQRSRRLIILNNSSGFHARDIFEDPVEGHEETRNYLRSVSAEAFHTGHLL